MAEIDRRFGGNMERANTGIPYPTGGIDVRFQESLPLQYQYRDKGRTVVSDTEPYYTDMGRNRNVPFSYSNRQPGIGEANIRPRGIEQLPSGNIINPFLPNMRIPNMLGPEGPQTAGLWQDIKRILSRTENPGPLIDQWTDHWNEQQTAGYDVTDASDWINAITGTGQSIYDAYQESPFGIDPFGGSIGYEFDLPLSLIHI